MRYYTVKVQINDDNTEIRDMRGFDTYDEANVKFHDSLAKLINGPNVAEGMMMIVNSEGMYVKSESWKKEQENTSTLG